jgi:protein SCO1
MTTPIEGTFSLVDHFGTPVTEQNYLGRWMLVFFGFTHCKEVCPRALARISGVLDDLGALADKVQPLYLTVDPERDSPQVMRAFLEPAYPLFTGLTGTEEQVEAAKKAFHVFARRKHDPYDADRYDVPHTAITYLLDPTGICRRHYPDSQDVQAVTADLRNVLSAQATTQEDI